MNLNVYPFLLQSEEDFKEVRDYVDAGNGDFTSSPYRYRHCGAPPRYPCLAKFRCEDNPNGPYECWWTFETEAELREKIDRLKAVS